MKTGEIIFYIIVALMVIALAVSLNGETMQEKCATGDIHGTGCKQIQKFNF